MRVHGALVLSPHPRLRLADSVLAPVHERADRQALVLLAVTLGEQLRREIGRQVSSIRHAIDHQARASVLSRLPLTSSSRRYTHLRYTPLAAPRELRSAHLIHSWREREAIWGANVSGGG